jgi:hypothetical protein
MAYEAGDKPRTKKGRQEEGRLAEVHKTAIEEYDRDYLKERNNIDEAYEDLRFRRGTLQDQWDQAALDARKNRPCHVVNKLPSSSARLRATCGASGRGSRLSRSIAGRISKPRTFAAG